MKSIEVNIAGRVYPVKVTEDEESIVLNIAAEINQKVTDFQSTYRGKDKQDYLSMALLTYALEYAKEKNNSNSMHEIKMRTEAIEALLDSVV